MDNNAEQQQQDQHRDPQEQDQDVRDQPWKNWVKQELDARAAADEDESEACDTNKAG
jgi:hypothetical protein